ncbi:MAG: Asp-tRNA(Asn)/Glu-tRNA(Gln) amidotransferase subunit GatC [Gemmatimonadota bacterium]
MTRIDPETVRHVARLARLRLDEAEVDQLGSEMSSILDHFAALEEVDVARQEGPTPRSIDPFLRQDVESADQLTLPVESLAPDVRAGLIVVPRLDALGGKNGES